MARRSLWRVEFTENAEHLLEQLQPTPEEIEALVVQLTDLKSDPKAGYPVPFLAFQEPLFRLDAGRFALIYTVQGRTVTVIDVFAD